MILRNWKTSLAALLIVVGTIWQCVQAGGTAFECVQSNWSALLAAVGLLFAKDFNKSGLG